MHGANVIQTSVDKQYYANCFLQELKTQRVIVDMMDCSAALIIHSSWEQLSVTPRGQL